MMQESNPAPGSGTPEEEHAHWRQKRFLDLSAPDSWLGLIGLYWLDPGINKVGSAPDSAVTLPEGAPYLGDLVWEGQGVSWRSAALSAAEIDNGEESEGEGVGLRTDAAGTPSKIRCGHFQFFVIEREGKLAVRLRDLAWREKQPFLGLDCYAFDRNWRIAADVQRLPEPRILEVPNVTGEIQGVSVSQQAVFGAGGQECTLLPIKLDSNGGFFVFRDQTSGKETYGGGRFLNAPWLAKDRLLLDFNRAYNPPCVFTAFATCPLPPPENWLSIAVRAGERRYAGSH